MTAAANGDSGAPCGPESSQADDAMEKCRLCDVLPIMRARTINYIPHVCAAISTNRKRDDDQIIVCVETNVYLFMK